jgi:16S rRNA processing protein RimM
MIEDSDIKFISVGKIINTHGLNGEVKVFPTTDDLNRFSLLKSVFINHIEYEIKNYRINKNLVFIKFKDVDDINAAEKLKGFFLEISKDKALPLALDEYYLCDLYNICVYDENNNFLGKLIEIIQTGAHDIYVVFNKDLKNKKSRKILIPAVKKFILSVDIKNKKMHVKLINGMT